MTYLKFLIILFVPFAFLHAENVSSSSQPSSYNSNYPIKLSSSLTPWKATGIIEVGNKQCMGIVTGKHEILTSAFCLIGPNGEKISKDEPIIFKGSFEKGFFSIKTQVKSFVMPKIIFPPHNLSDIENSWAYLITAENISSVTGRIDVNTTPITSSYLKNHKLITVGYPSNNPNQLNSSIKCLLDAGGVKYNDANQGSNKSTPLIIQKCNDYFKPLLGAMLLSIDKDNNAALVGVLSATITPKPTSNNTKIKSKSMPKGSFHVYIPTTVLDPAALNLNKEDQ